ncbi:MAG: hypothetical protein VYC34_11820, partial [Planctomycetota bacterium]|nr:hypothetical protein [Planctomycetota bacterium]
MRLGRIGNTAKALTAFALGAVIAASAAAQFVTVDPTKANGFFIAGTGIPADGFVSDSNGDVSVYLKSRGRPGTGFSGVPVIASGNTYVVLSGFDGSGIRTWWNWDFHFTPSESDTVNGHNYVLTLEFDTDPTEATSFIVISLPIFDADSDQANSWDDNDGYFENPGPGAWSNDNIDYVFSQSWRYEFIGLTAAELGPGDYDIRWSASDESGNVLASVSVTTRVIDAASPSVSLDAQDACLNAGENQLVVDINMANAMSDIVGGQFFLEYDKAVLDFVSADPGDAPFDMNEVYEFVDEGAGTIDYAVGIPLGGMGTATATTMA